MPAEYIAKKELTLEDVQLDRALIDDIRHVVNQDNVDGFMLYHLLEAGCPLPSHAIDWTRTAYEGRELGMDAAIEAFRGSIKTTTFTNHFTTYHVGLYPWKSNLFIQASDDTARLNVKFAAGIIEFNPAFKLLFPTVVPDQDRGFGVQGYYVKDTSVPYGEFLQRTTKDPTLLGAGYRSSDILGMHPNGLMILDDIHDHKNTRSNRLFQEVLEIHAKVIIPLRTPTTWRIDIFTPWREGDIGDRRKKSRFCVHCRTPIAKEVNGELDLDQPTWPEVFPTKVIKQLKEDLTVAEFAQSYALNLKAAEGQVLKKQWLHYFPAEQIKKDWQSFVAVDYASIESQQQAGKRDRYALAAGRITPEGKLVICDGFVGHLTQADGEDKLDEFMQLMGADVAGIEKLGKGEEFYLRKLRTAPYTVKGMTVGNLSKGWRFEKQLAPVFRDSLVLISDEPNNEYLEQLVREWLEWDGTEKYFDDCLDAAYHLVRVAKGNIMLQEHPAAGKKKQKAPSNWAWSFGRK